jgi:hypothetical protein
MLFGVTAFRGFCRGDHLGQCLAHYIMVCLHRVHFFPADDPAFRGVGSLRMVSSSRFC